MSKYPVHRGDIICYRPNLVKVLRVEKSGLWIEDPYGVKQKIDWEDYYLFNREG